MSKNRLPDRTRHKSVQIKTDSNGETSQIVVRHSEDWSRSDDQKIINFIDEIKKEMPKEEQKRLDEYRSHFE